MGGVAGERGALREGLRRRGRLGDGEGEALRGGLWEGGCGTNCSARTSTGERLSDAPLGKSILTTTSDRGRPASTAGTCSTCSAMGDASMSVPRSSACFFCGGTATSSKASSRTSSNAIKSGCSSSRSVSIPPVMSAAGARKGSSSPMTDAVRSSSGISRRDWDE